MIVTAPEVVRDGLRHFTRRKFLRTLCRFSTDQAAFRDPVVATLITLKSRLQRAGG